MSEMALTEAEVGTRLKQQVADTLIERIASGVYRPGDKLPSIRELSRILQVSLTTVKGAYAILEIDGYVVVHQQSGIYVRLRKAQDTAKMRTNPPLTPMTMSIDEVMDGVVRDYLRPRQHLMSNGAPNTDLLPTRGLKSAIRKAGIRVGEWYLQYSETRGLPELREQIAQQAMLRGCVLDPTDLIITNGCTEALSLALSTVVGPGDIVAVESPAYPGLLSTMKSQGLRILEISSSPDHGMDVEVLESSLASHQISAVFVTPNYCNPLGSQMPLAARKHLVEILAEREIPLIEDDIYGDLSHDQRPMPTCKSFDQKGLVLLCSSFSKTLSPGLRIGWVAAGRFDGGVLARKSAGTVCTSAINQMVVNEFLCEHRYSRVVGKASTAYFNNMRNLVACVHRTFPEGTLITEPTGGFLNWVQLPEGFSSRRLAELSLPEGISFVPGFKYSAHDLYGNCLRLTAAHWDKDVEEQVELLGHLAKSIQP